MKNGFVKVATFLHDLVLADPRANARSLTDGIVRCAREGAKVVVTPAMGLVGITAGDLLRQSALLSATRDALGEIVAATREVDALCIVGLPLDVDGKLYNAAAIMHGGDLLGVVAKSRISPAEARYFAPTPQAVQIIRLCDQDVPFGGWQIFDCANVPHLSVGVEFGDELGSPSAPHNVLAAAGATIVCNLSAEPTLPGSAAMTLKRVQVVGADDCVAYVLANAKGESTTDSVYGGQQVIAQCGDILAEAAPFGVDRACGVVDVESVAYDRKHGADVVPDADVCRLEFYYEHVGCTALDAVSPYPFIPADEEAAATFYEETFALQVQGLSARMRRIGCKKLVLGVSGGLDSTMALLVCKGACKALGYDAKESVVCLTMPCFGTTDRTKNNALSLCEALGLACREINIGAAVTQHLKDIGHPLDVPDVTFENAQARMRAMVLMDVANAEGGIVVGTGDLSELALGWCTYNGDHMSMYAVNGTLTKTTMRRMIAYFASKGNEALKTVLADILDTPVSPELLPNVKGQIAQKTEEIVGKYDLNDFILYHMIRHGSNPAKIYRLARVAFPAVDEAKLHESFVRFYRRFFSQQFKRSCSPDGAKAGVIDLSPRGEWQMPSDATAAAWLAELDEIK